MTKVGCIALFCIINQQALPAATPAFKLKENFNSGKKNICLSEILTVENLPAREQEKLTRYCRIELNQATLTLNAKDAELHAWAAGVIPEKISGSRVTITYVPGTPAGEQAKNTAPMQRLRRGTTVNLILKSANMQIAREGQLLTDTFPGETVEVRLSGTRRNFRAKLINNETAELISP